MKLKSEIRNPKSETNSKFETFNLRFISNFVLCASCLLVFATPLTIFAQGFVPLAEIPGLTSGVTADTAGLAKFFNNLYRFTIGVAGVLAVIMIIWGGLEISTQDSVSKKSDGKQRIYNAIFGLVLVLSPVLIFSIINPKILNLSLNLPPIDLTTAPVTITSCPQYQTGIPPNCTPLPLCTSTLRTNCTPVAAAAFDEGSYPTPPSGAACYELATTDSSGNNYMCFRRLSGAMSCNQILSSNSDTGATARKAGVTVCTQY